MKYRKLASDLEYSIRRGALALGQKLPSVRSLAQNRQLSISTVVQAYRELEKRALIEARPRSGYFVSAVPKTASPQTQPRILTSPRSMTHFEDLMPDILDEAEDASIMRLGLSHLEPELVASDELKQLTRKALRTSGQQIFEYPPTTGLTSLKRHICALMSDRGVNTVPDEVVITSGCQEALWMALSCVAKQGDTIAVESPCYPGLLKILQLMELKVLEIPARSTQGLDLDRLRFSISKLDIGAVYVMPNCSNPRGDVFPDDNKSALYQLAADHNLMIIEDDSNRDLYFGQHGLSSLKAYDDRGIVMFCSSFSKTVAPAYRLGWLLPGRYHDQSAAYKYALNLSAPAVSQLVISEFIANGGYRRHLNRIRPILLNSLHLLCTTIREELPGANFDHPLGGSFVWTQLTGSIDSRRLRKRMLEHNISIAPGTLFSPSPSYRSFVRLGWGGRWNRRVENAIRTLARAVKSDAAGN